MADSLCRLAQDHGRRHFFAPGRRAERRSNRLGYGGMPEQHLVDFPRARFFRRRD